MKVVSVKRKNGTRIFVFRWRDRFRKWNESSSEIVDNGGKLARREAERKAAEMEVELENERISISWAAFCARYANEHLPSLAHKSAVAWHTARRKLEAIINPEQLLDVTADCLSIFAAKLRCQSVQLKENTITTYLRTIHAALSWAHLAACG